MPILEKPTQHSQARHWTDSIPLEFHYTAGVAGEEFLRELKETGKFLASKCSRCKNMYIPARMYCPDCFIETKEYVKIEKPGYVYSFTSVNKDRAGKQTGSSMIVALIKFNGVKGGLAHLVDAKDSSSITFGVKVEPILKEPSERKGTPTDIIAFRPVLTEP